ncbi:hypothetical protein HK102_007521, partial [Quaeritorhiza haematococci]
KYGVSVEQADMAIRQEFVRKVYTILAVQLGLTTVVSGIFMSSDAVKEWAINNPWMLWTSMFATIVTMLGLIWKRRSHPTNLYLLGLFTLLESYAIGFIVAFSDQIVVLKAVILTFALFIGLTLFTLQTKYDFSGMAPFLFGALWVIIAASFMHMFFSFGSGFEFALSVGIAILFGGFIVYDTYNIFNRLSPEEYIIASVELYLDILNLFLAILRILGNRD